MFACCRILFGMFLTKMHFIFFKYTPFYPTMRNASINQVIVLLINNCQWILWVTFQEKKKCKHLIGFRFYIVNLTPCLVWIYSKLNWISFSVGLLLRQNIFWCCYSSFVLRTIWSISRRAAIDSFLYWLIWWLFSPLFDLSIKLSENNIKNIQF